MSERDYAPLSAACVRALNDKIYDKRKAAALEIEKMVKEFNSINNSTQIKKLLKVLGQDFANSQNANTRKGGLIGLAAISIALGKDTADYLDDLVNPILACFSDSDLRVRYYACESLYNVVKVARDSILVHFCDIFAGLGKLAADPDQNVKNGSELLDRLMKDIVTESSAFDLVNFIPLLRERMYSRNPFARQFVISWVSVLNAVPDIDLIMYLPELIDGLFRILEDTTLEIKKMCDTVLNEFLRSIKMDPSRVDFAKMINILIAHSQASDELLQFTAISWILEFVQMAGENMLPYTSGILTAVLPCLAYDSETRRNIKEAAKEVNLKLMQLIATNTDAARQGLDIESVVDVLTRHLNHASVPTKVCTLKWIYHLHGTLPDKIILHVDEIFPALLKVLSDPADQVVIQDIEVIAEIVSDSTTTAIDDNNVAVSKISSKNRSLNQYFTKFISSLLKLFKADRVLLEDRGSFIIRQLCVLLNSEDIYRTLSKILLRVEYLKFASLMIETLNLILLTSEELYELRTKLKELKTEDSCSLFCCLYQSWCHNPVATVALCFLTQNYAHACQLIRIFGDLEVTLEILIEIDKLVHLIESPIFTFVRLELLEVPHNQALVQALYGLLMLLPQSEAFHLLRQRLQCIPSLHLSPLPANQRNEASWSNRREKRIDFSHLLDHFKLVQENHRIHKQVTAKQELRDKSVQSIQI